MFKNSLVLFFFLPSILGLSISGFSLDQLALDPISVLNSFKQDKQPMPANGNYANDYIENKEKRSSDILTLDQKIALGLDKNGLYISNFRHQGEFYIARIPGFKSIGNTRKSMKISETILEMTTSKPGTFAAPVRKVEFWKEHWSGTERPATANWEVHAELIFKLNNDHKGNFWVQLIINQSDFEKSSDNSFTKKTEKNAPRVSDIVLSIEAVRSRLEPDTPFMPAGIGPNFAIAYRIYSLDELKNKYIKYETEKITKIPFTFTERDIKSSTSILRPQDSILVKAIQTSNLKQRKTPYQAFGVNCTNLLFEVIDQSLETPFIRRPFVREVKRVTEEEIFKLASFFKQIMKNKSGSFMKEYAQHLPPKALELIDSLVNGDPNKTSDRKIFEAAKLASDYLAEAAKEGADEQFLYVLTPYIDAHIKARNLWPKNSAGVKTVSF